MGIGMDIDSDMAVSITWGSMNRGVVSFFRQFGIDIRQVLSDPCESFIATSVK